MGSLPKRGNFHTSCRLRGEGITPTVDAVCFPPEKPTPERKNWMQVPFLPDNYAPNRPPIMLELIETDIRPQTPAPQISTVADLSTHFSVPSVVSDFHDRATVESDVIGSVENPLKRGLSVMPPAEPGLVKELWGSFLDDLLGGRSGHGK
ncbi:MAG: hypothetical protein M1829_000878 [Trizodia sp. TS-e1964]|nr:MAG: hypothetical protein M1829_000878 [Trizodia sp. TS-e1964]